MANFILRACIATWCCAMAVDGVELQTNCSGVSNCKECIQTFGCGWCAEPGISSERCQNANKTECSNNFLINPKSSHSSTNLFDTTSEKEKNSHKKSAKVTKKNIISVTPQFVNLTMRPNRGHPFRIKMRYHHAPDYPLDIYYLMDLSKSLLEEKLSLAMEALVQDLKKKISGMTKDLRLGFGSFVDKPVTPFISLDPKIQEKPCSECIPTYAFRNNLHLTENISSFSKTVSSLNLSSNLDSPEGGLDGIMQVIVCRKEIGWRKEARKLLIYSTDAPFHIAGDGKVVGIITPNDGCCHLDKLGYYTRSTNQDYPSIQQLRLKVKENDINLILAVPKNQSALYTKLTDVIDGASVGVKKESSSYKDVIRIITEQYKKITSGIQIQESNLLEQLHIRYYSKCLNSSGSLLETKKCESLKINDTVEFELDIELVACPANVSQWNHQFHIKPQGVEEKMTINLTMICDCACDSKDKKKVCEEHSSKCSGHGSYKFGVCHCDPGFSGHNCSCPFKEDITINCRANLNDAICSNRGTCECNQCHCEAPSPTQIFWGQFCQCSNFSCPYNQGKICSGNGNCVCNNCVCNKGWSGEDCKCEDSQENCQLGSNGEICSERGNCVCNKCVCNQTGVEGRYCEKCPTCPKRCGEFKDCVICQIHPKHKTCSTDICKNINTTMVDNLEEFINHQDYVECTENDSPNCRFMYGYKIIRKKIEIKIKGGIHCNEGAPVLELVISVITAIVLIGFLLLMLWKIFVIIQDRREFSKFEEERTKAMWQNADNPLYVAPSTRYRNPLYEDKSDWSYKSAKKD